MRRYEVKVARRSLGIKTDNSKKLQEEKGGMELQSSVHAEVKAVATELRCINQGSLCCSTTLHPPHCSDLEHGSN